ncbi:MAG: transposase [Anaerolineae bacterium]|nr:transposase [Anaerolineae bacterium]
MPQPRPEYLPGNYYHFFNRGAHKNSIFREPNNYFHVLGRMKKYAEKYHLAIIVYVLMPNHYHFLVRQDGESPARYLPRYVFNSYSKHFNKRYEHSGTLFEGKYKVKLVHKESYLLHLCRYIHGNPVKDALVADPADWPYSNYLEWIGDRDGTLFTPEFVREYFSSPADYRDFVFEGLRGRNLPDDIKLYLDNFEM